MVVYVAMEPLDFDPDRGERKRYHMTKKNNTTANTTTSKTTTGAAKKASTAKTTAAKKPRVENAVRPKKAEPVAEEVPDLSKYEQVSSEAVKKMRKSDLLEFLQNFCRTAYFKRLTKETTDSLVYTSKNIAKATVSDLRELVSDTLREFQLMLAEDASAKVPAPANSVKKKLRSKKAEPEVVVEEPAKEPVEETEEEPEEEQKPKKALRKKGTTKKVEKTEEVVIDDEPMFPSELTLSDGDEDVVLVNVDAEFKDYDAVANAVNEEGRDLCLATRWTRDDLKAFKYSGVPGIKNPKSFQNDLDIIQVIYAGDKVVVGVSRYTEGPCYMVPKDFTPNKDGVRVKAKAEFAIYEEK